MKPLNKKGFSAIYVVLIIAIVGIIGFTGWYVWSKNQTPKVSSYQECVKAKGAKILETYPEQCVINGQTFVNPSQKAAASMTTQTNNPTVQLPATTHRYLTIKEWGVKIPVSSDIYDLIYSIDNALYLNSEKFIAVYFCSFSKPAGIVLFSDISSIELANFREILSASDKVTRVSGFISFSIISLSK